MRMETKLPSCNIRELRDIRDKHFDKAWASDEAGWDDRDKIAFWVRQVETAERREKRELLTIKKRALERGERSRKCLEKRVQLGMTQCIERNEKAEGDWTKLMEYVGVIKKR